MGVISKAMPSLNKGSMGVILGNHIHIPMYKSKKPVLFIKESNLGAGTS
jgi:hypothetical protein